MTTKRAVLFDLDGVIIDSESLYTVFWNDMDRLYPTGVENFAKVIKGSTLPKIFETYFPDMEVREHINSLLVKFEAEMEAELFPGICDMIEGLRAAGFATAIVTSSNLPKMQKLFARLPQIEKLMDVVLTDADVEKSKPDPEGSRTPWLPPRGFCGVRGFIRRHRGRTPCRRQGSGCGHYKRLQRYCPAG